jgi:hypothetical protein
VVCNRDGGSLAASFDLVNTNYDELRDTYATG